ncbi:7-carboxy-7-deazaguanine synthase QueE [Alkalihalobacterium elongatum]|uniref:7-carboxy-7-deazaguanine synthase QueE n=1 Tax=Alkalihalobacterium elongatum TaxID=2675466 RepID=UPI001C1F6FAE|nr:7-carboxy-7-deazaguanine synthase QueE [Alkalihalobacterium elongatum]
MANNIPVIEVFGPTIQGEGMVVGRKTMFVRTAGCDYRCSWCDSAFTWDGSAKDQIKQMSAEQIYEELKQTGEDRFDHVTISGGNPALYAAIDELIDVLQGDNIKIGLETQGSKWQDWFTKVDDLTLSPKPPSSGMDTNFETLDKIINQLKENNRLEDNVSIKVVIFNDEDLNYAKNVHVRYKDVPFFLQVGNEDLQDIEPSQLMHKLISSYERLIEKVIASKELNQVKVLPQLHTLLWGNKRGV